MALAMQQRRAMMAPGARVSAAPRIAPAARARVSARSAMPDAATAVVVQEASTDSAVHLLSGETYESFLASNDLVLVDYYTDWCGPCKMIAPHLEDMAKEMPHIKFAKLNCTSEAAAKKIAMSQGIKALPTFHIFRNNTRVGVFVGGKPSQLRKFVEEYGA